MKTIHVTFLIDATNDWLFTHLLTNSPISTDHRYHYHCSTDVNNIKEQDIVFALGYTTRLSDAFLTSNRLVLVVHESDLPKGVGFSPVQWQILEGDCVIPVCLLKATNHVDAGPIILKEEILLKGTELYDEIRALQAQATIRLIKEFLLKYPNITYQEQHGTRTNYRKRKRSDDELDVDRTIREQFNKLRVGNNQLWPTYFRLNGETFILQITKEANKLESDSGNKS